MEIKYTKKFLKQYYKLSPKIQTQFQERLLMWQNDPQAALLKVHNLSGKYRHYSSLRVNGDVRALFKTTKRVVTFGFIGTHSQLY